METHILPNLKQRAEFPTGGKQSSAASEILCIFKYLYLKIFLSFSVL